MTTKQFWTLIGVNILIGVSSFFFYVSSVYGFSGDAGQGQIVTSMILFMLVLLAGAGQFYWFRFQQESTRTRLTFGGGVLLLIFVVFRIFSQQLSQIEVLEVPSNPVFTRFQENLSINKDDSELRNVTFQVAESNQTSSHPTYVYDFVFSLKNEKDFSLSLVSSLMGHVPSSVQKPFLFTFYTGENKTVVAFSANGLIVDCYSTSSTKLCKALRDPLSSDTLENVRNQIAMYNIERSHDEPSYYVDENSSTDTILYIGKGSDEIKRTDIRTVYEMVLEANKSETLTIFLADEGRNPVDAASVVFTMSDVNLSKKTAILSYTSCQKEFCTNAEPDVFYISN